MNAIEMVLARLQEANVEHARIQIKENQVFTLTASELLAVCEKNPKHPNSAIMMSAVVGIPPNEEVNVDRVDLEAILSDRQVKISSSQERRLLDGKPTIITTVSKILDPASEPKDEVTDKGG